MDGSNIVRALTEVASGDRRVEQEEVKVTGSLKEIRNVICQGREATKVHLRAIPTGPSLRGAAEDRGKHPC
jgi:hypothetical protein